jgi:hypothetical protein
MTSKKEPFERRQEKRFRVKEGALVILKPADTGTGRIIDISMGGLTFEHLSSQRAPFEATELDILLTGSAFSLYDVPCRSIWNLTIYEKPQASLYKTRYGVQFGELTPGQMSLLEYFIQNHTTGEAA